MPPFRPTNLNKRAYPGNASVIGPTRTATVGFTTSNVGFTTNPVAVTCCCQQLCLGCRCSFCGCPCCCTVCAYPLTVCDRTVPSGMWKASEQLEARKRDAWGDDSCSCGPEACLCCINRGFCAITNVTDCVGFFICCGPSTNKWFVSPFCTEVSRTWGSKGGAVTLADSCMGACGWFVADLTQHSDPGFCCRTYWDCYSNFWYWTTTDCNADSAFVINMAHGGAVTGGLNPGDKGRPNCVRAFRCTPT